MAKNKYTDLDDDNIDIWKDKYTSNLEELEKKEKQWAASEKNLRALIMHLTNAADTSSAKLTKQLSVLRNAINKGIDASKLNKAIDEVADSVLVLDKVRNKRKNEPKKYFTLLLDKIKPAGKIEGKLSKLSTKIKNSDEDLSPFVTELAKLLVHGLSLGENKKNKGLFSLFTDEENKANNKSEESNEENEDVSDVIVEEVKDLNLGAAIKSLLSLLDKMALPADLQPKSDLIKRQLTRHADESLFLKALEHTVALVSTILGRVKKEKKELEDFLNKLTSRLHELDGDIQDVARARELAHKYGVKIAEVMKSEISSMGKGFEKINNIEGLKNSVQSRVIMLRDHVDKFLLNEERQNKEALVIIEQLKDKVKVMEEDARVLKEQLVKEREQSLIDALTEMPNRLAYEEEVALEITKYAQSNSKFILVVWDIDYFKKINDEYGHTAGDQMLKLVATIIRNSLRETDFFARYGGEEFVSIFPTTSLKEAQFITDKVRQAIEVSDFHFRDKAVNVTISAGFAAIDLNENEESLFTRADKALYKAKKAGHNRCNAA